MLLVELPKLLLFVLIDFFFLTLLLIPGLTFAGCVIVVGAEDALHFHSLWKWKEASRVTLGVLLGLRNLARPWLDCQCPSSRLARQLMEVGSLLPTLRFLYWMCQCLYPSKSHPSTAIVRGHSTKPGAIPSLETDREREREGEKEKEKEDSAELAPVEEEKATIFRLENDKRSSSQTDRLPYDLGPAVILSSLRSDPFRAQTPSFPHPFPPRPEHATSRASSLQLPHWTRKEDGKQGKANDRYASSVLAVGSPPISPKNQHRDHGYSAISSDPQEPNPPTASVAPDASPPQETTVSDGQEVQPWTSCPEEGLDEDGFHPKLDSPSLSPTTTLACEQPFQAAAASSATNKSDNSNEFGTAAQQPNPDGTGHLYYQLSQEEYQWCEAEVSKNCPKEPMKLYYSKLLDTRWGDEKSAIQKQAMTTQITLLEKNKRLEMLKKI